MKQTIAITITPGINDRPDHLRLVNNDRSTDIILTGEFVITDFRSKMTLGPCGAYHHENRYGVCRICAQTKAAETRKNLTTTKSVINSIRGEEDEES